MSGKGNIAVKLEMYRAVAAYERSTTRYVRVYKDEVFVGYLKNDMTLTMDDVVDSSSKMTKGGYYHAHINVLERELPELTEQVRKRLMSGLDLEDWWMAMSKSSNKE